VRSPRSTSVFDYVAKIVVTVNITHTFDGDIA